MDTEKLLERVPSVTELFPDQTRGEGTDPPLEAGFLFSCVSSFLGPP